jgi:phage gpG-like protein
MASFSARILVDEVSPVMAKLKATLTNLGPILESIGLQIVDITQKAFVDESLRAAPWPPKRDGSPATLIKSGMLRQSIRIVEIGSTSVTVGSDRVYAAVHQLGSREYQAGASVDIKSRRVLVARYGTTSVYARRQNLPPRPFFPIDADGNFTETATERISKVLDQALGAALQ